jgi:hypothetical protein
MFTSMIFIYSWIWSYDHWWPTQWPHSVKRLHMCETACWKKHMLWNKNIDGFYRVHEIAYGFGGPSEKNVSPH